MPFIPATNSNSGGATPGFIPASPNTTSQPKQIPTVNPMATFPAQTIDSPLQAGLKTLGNLPSSTLNFTKNLINAPIQGLKDLTQIPGEATKLVQEQGLGGAIKNLIPALGENAYKGLVPEAARNLVSGDTQGAQQAITNDPVGQILPFLMLGREAATKAGYGEQFDNAVSQVAKPVTNATSAVASKVGGGIGNLASNTLGVGTGAGSQSIKSAVNGSQAFFDAMRGKTTPEQTVQNMESAFNTLKQNRANEYTTKLQEISKNGNANIDVSPINDQLQKQLANFKVTDNNGQLNFSQSPIRFDKSAQADVQNIYDTMKNYGTQASDRTAVGVDSLKKAFGDLYSQSSNVRAFIQSMKDTTRQVLNKNVPGYEDMTKGYETASNLINDIKSATSLGKNNNYDAVFSKVTTALKADKDFRLQMLNELENTSGQKLVDAIAGHNLSKWVPSGLIGRGMDVGAAYALLQHVFNPSMIGMALSTSPRVMGEFLGGLGIAKNYTMPILKAINMVKVPTTTGLLGGQKLPQQQSQSTQ